MTPAVDPAGDPRDTDDDALLRIVRAMARADAYRDFDAALAAAAALPTGEGLPAPAA